MSEKSRKNLSFFMFFISFAAFLVLSSRAWAAGFYLQEQSAVAMGTAFAGASAEPRNASIIYYNPAGMAELDGGQISVNSDVIFARDNMVDRGSTYPGAITGGIDSDDAIPTMVIGNFYMAYPFMDGDLWAGFGVSTPFGLATEYDEDWFGRYDSIESELITVDLQHSIAYKLYDWFSIGGGIDIQYVDAELTSAASNGAVEGLSKLTGSDWSFGYNLGFLLEIWDETNLGVHYRSQVKHVLDGRITVTGVPGANEDSSGTADLNLPDILSVAMSHHFNDHWTFLGQVNWFGWDSFERITAVRDSGTIASNVEQGYEPSMSFAAGAEYHWNDDLTLRAGYQYDQTPTVDEFRTTRTPDGDRHHFSGGFSYDITDKVTLNGSGMYGLMDDEDIDVTRNSGLARALVDREDTSYVFLSVGLAYKF